MRLSRCAWAAAAAAASIWLAACSGKPSRKQIAVIPKATSHLFWLSVQAGAFEAGRRLDVEVLWNGPSAETEYSRQIQIVDSMVARGVDGIAIAATERKALVQAVERAVAAGIPVTVFDSGLDSDKYMTFLATNNYEGGQMAARELADQVGGAGDVALLMHAPGSQSTMDRERGFEDTLQKEFPRIRIVARQFGMSDRAKARAAAENFLTGQAELKGIFASAEPSSLGASLAIKARNLQDKIALVGFDSSESLVEDLKTGAVDALVVQDPYFMGFEAVRTLVDKLNGRTPPKQIDLHARVIRKDDLAKPDVQKLLFPTLQQTPGKP